MSSQRSADGVVAGRKQGHFSQPFGRETASRLPGARRILVAVLPIVLLFLVSCNVTDSTRIDLQQSPALGYAPPCQSALGSYALPKGFLQIQIGQTSSDAPPDIAVATADGSPVNTIRHPDPSLVFCLDYLASAFSDDNIQVIKSPLPGAAAAAAQTTVQPQQNTNQATPNVSQNTQNSTQNVQSSGISTFISGQSSKQAFLGAVTFNVTDQTAYIIQALIRAGFIVASGNGQFAPRNAVFMPNQIVADLEYDPFDRVESANVNARLQKLGVCLVLEAYTFDPGVGIENYCNDPLRYGTRQTLYTKAYRKAEETPANPQWPGLLYRPRYPYRLYIFRKIDPKGPGRWKLSQTTTVRLENLSPVISLGVTRAVFAGKNVSFVFNEGALQTTCVAKTSEVEGFVQIPLEVAKSLVALPASIISVQIGNAGKQAQLVQAEQQLYLMQRAYLLNLMGHSTAAPSGVPTTATTPPLPDPSNFTTPADLVPAPDILTSGSPIASYGTDLIQNSNLSNICQGKS